MSTALSKSSEKHRQYTPSRNTKEFWENFEPEEMGAIAAFVKSFQKIIFFFRETSRDSGTGNPVDTIKAVHMPYQILNHTNQLRPWTPIERLFMAIDALVYGIDPPSLKRVTPTKRQVFRVATWDKGNNTVTSTANLPEDATKASKEIYDAVIRWDIPFLDECVSKYGPFLEKLGFKKIDAADFSPLTMDPMKSSQSLLGLMKKGEVTTSYAKVNLAESIKTLLEFKTLSEDALVDTLQKLTPGLTAVPVLETLREMVEAKTIRKNMNDNYQLVKSEE